MIGLIALAILGFWGLISYKLSAFLVKKIKIKEFKCGFQLILCILFFLAPVADDIAGGFQFRDLCRKDATIRIDEDNSQGKVVSFFAEKSQLDGYILVVKKTSSSYRDIYTGKPIISWNTYNAKGGWLSKLLNFPEGNPPYTFNGSCGPKNYWDNVQKLKSKFNLI